MKLIACALFVLALAGSTFVARNWPKNHRLEVQAGADAAAFREQAAAWQQAGVLERHNRAVLLDNDAQEVEALRGDPDKLKAAKAKLSADTLADTLARNKDSAGPDPRIAALEERAQAAESAQIVYQGGVSRNTRLVGFLIIIWTAFVYTVVNRNRKILGD